MRTSPFENPRKLWGKIEKDDIPKDSYIQVKISQKSYGNFDKYAEKNGFKIISQLQMI